MKPFDLQSALAGAKVVTRDGREVKIAGYNPEANDYWHTLIGWVGGYYCQWNHVGQHFTTCGSDYDLFMAPTERKEWVLVYTDNGCRNSAIFNNNKSANDYMAIISKHDGYNDISIHEITIHE